MRAGAHCDALFLGIKSGYWMMPANKSTETGRDPHLPGVCAHRRSSDRGVKSGVGEAGPNESAMSVGREWNGGLDAGGLRVGMGSSLVEDDWPREGAFRVSEEP